MFIIKKTKQARIPRAPHTITHKPVQLITSKTQKRILHAVQVIAAPEDTRSKSGHRSASKQHCLLHGFAHNCRCSSGNRLHRLLVSIGALWSLSDRLVFFRARLRECAAFEVETLTPVPLRGFLLLSQDVEYGSQPPRAMEYVSRPGALPLLLCCHEHTCTHTKACLHQTAAFVEVLCC